MQTLGISESTPRSESRLKSLLWPSVTTPEDVDYLGTQGFWVSTIIGLLSFCLILVSSSWWIATIVFLIYFLGGIGVRERSRYAALVMLIIYSADLLVAGVSIVRIIITFLFISNVRATWIAATWKPDSPDHQLPPRLNETFLDKLSDQIPAKVWPYIRPLYYVFSLGFLFFYLAVIYYSLVMRKAFP